MKTLRTKKCINCGTEFTYEFGVKYFCSDRCRDREYETIGTLHRKMMEITKEAQGFIAQADTLMVRTDLMIQAYAKVRAEMEETMQKYVDFVVQNEG